jgi:acyl-CoA thioesterase
MTMNKAGIDILSPWLGKPVDGLYERMLGITLDSVERGKVQVSCIPTEKHYNIMARVHGGLCASLLDTAMGCAVMSALDPFIPFGTVQLNVHYVRKIDGDSGKLTCVATVLHSGRSMFTSDARVVDAAGHLCAHGTGTFLVYPSP